MPKASTRPVKPKPIEDPIAEILEAWRSWLIGALVGALLAAGIYLIFPPDFRARATVVVDNNLEEAWVAFPDRRLFQFLQRETERLQELAWSDSVMQTVVAAANDISVQELRASVLQLSQPADGGWHFYAMDLDQVNAQKMASAWAEAFVKAARAAVEASPELQAARHDLDTALLSTPDPGGAQIQELMERVAQLAEQTKGISPFIELYVSQDDDLPVERRVSLGTFLLLGSTVGAIGFPLWFILRPQGRSRRK